MYGAPELPQLKSIVLWLLLGAAIGMFLTLGSVYLAKASEVPRCTNSSDPDAVRNYDDKILGAILLVVGLFAIPMALILPRCLRLEQMHVEQTL